MRVFLSTPIRGVHAGDEIYRLMYAHLQQMGVSVEGAFGLSLEAEQGLDDRRIYTRDITALERSDIVLAEVSTPSTGVGFEIAHAVAMGIPVVCVHEKGASVSAMVVGCPELRTYAYADAGELCALMSRALSQLTRL